MSFYYQLPVVENCLEKCLHGRCPPMKSYNPLIICSFKITWQTKTIIYPLPECLWPPNLEGRWLTLWGSYPYWVIWSFGYMVLQDHITNYNHTTMPTKNKLEEMVNYHEVLLNIKSHTSSIKWSCKITW